MDNNVFTHINNINDKLKEELGYTMSVSKCLEYLKHPFDFDKKSKELSARDFDKPGSKYYQMTPEQIVAKWNEKGDAARKLGSSLDDYIGYRLTNDTWELENWKLDNNYEYDTDLKAVCTGFEQFYEIITTQLNYQFVCRETQLYISDGPHFINGRFDCLFYSPTLNKYLLVDWKTSEEIEKVNKYKTKLQGPGFKLDECNGNLYTTQLYFYKKSLAETYKICNLDQIDTYIVQMTRTPQGNGKYFLMHKPNYEYDDLLLRQFIDFGYKKNEIEKKRS